MNTFPRRFKHEIDAGGPRHQSLNALSKCFARMLLCESQKSSDRRLNVDILKPKLSYWQKLIAARLICLSIVG